MPCKRFGRRIVKNRAHGARLAIGAPGVAVGDNLDGRVIRRSRSSVGQRIEHDVDAQRVALP
jgi:hypothetical protein